MKKIYIALLACGILGFGSCTLDRYPYNSIPGDVVEKDVEANIDYLMTGTYSILKSWSDGMHRIGEYPADNIMIRSSSTDAFFDFISYRHGKTNYRVYNHWFYNYRAITQCNDLIEIMTKTGDSKYTNRIGEAHYLRGLCYFNLTTIFGRPYYDNPDTNLGVPINLKGVPKDLNDIYAPDRSTVKDCYAQALNDLKKAENLLTEDKSAAYATKEAAQALMSRMYLYMSGTYQNVNTVYADSAIYYAQQVIGSGKYQLLDRNTFMIGNTFTPESPSQTETIFAVKRVEEEFTGGYGNTIGSMYATINGEGWGEMYATAKYMDLLKLAGHHKEDARWAFIDPQFLLSNGNKTPSFRFVADIKDKTGVVTTYRYVQQPLQSDAAGYFIEADFTDANEVVTKIKYPLTVVNAADNLYSINWKHTDGSFKTYVGEKDYMMALNQGHPMFYVTKCSLQEKKAHLYSPVVSRLAELYLNMAEAYAKKGDYGNAKTYVNMIRERSVVGGGYPVIDATNAEELIAQERQLELAYEGHRAFDVFRNGGTMKRHYPGAHDPMVDIPATSKSIVHFIPQKEIDAYPGPLTQNPD